MSNFQEYPKAMSHPHHAAAVVKQLEGKGVGIFTPGTEMVSPERFPSVTAMNQAHEEYYAARGYRPNNNPDPVAYEQALMESTYVPGYSNNEYPKWKYHAFEVPVIVKNSDAENALGAGWEDSPVLATEEDLIENPVALQATLSNPVSEKVDKRSKAYKESQRAKA